MCPTQCVTALAACVFCSSSFLVQVARPALLSGQLSAHLAACIDLKTSTWMRQEFCSWACGATFAWWRVAQAQLALLWPSVVVPVSNIIKQSLTKTSFVRNQHDKASASSSSSLISMMSAAPLSFSDSESVLLSSVGLAWQAYGIGTKLWCPCDWKAIKFAPVPHYAHRNGISHRCLPATYKHSNNICRSESKSELLSLCKIHICYQQGKNNEQ